MVVVLFAFALFAVDVADAAAGGRDPECKPLSQAVRVMLHVDDQRYPGVREAMTAVAIEVWGPEGVTFQWLHHGTPIHESEAQNVLSVAASDFPRRVDDLVSGLGWIEWSGVRGGPAIRISLSAIARWIEGRSAGSSADSQRLLIARAAGYVFAHEIGHHLLATPGHTSAGLMRAQFDFEDLLDSGTPFVLDAGSRAALRARTSRRNCAPVR